MFCLFKWAQLTLQICKLPREDGVKWTLIQFWEDGGHSGHGVFLGMIFPAGSLLIYIKNS